MKQKERITANQFDQVLLEQINLLTKKLFGGRDSSKHSLEFVEALHRLIEDARVERAEYEMKEREARRKQEADKPRIILPGQQRN